MKRLLAFTLGVVLVLLLAAPAAAVSTAYGISLGSIVGGSAHLIVTRSESATGTSSDPVMWVTTDCFDGNGDQLIETWQDDAPVIWGTPSNLSGYVDLPVFGAACTAWATVSPWRPKHNDPFVIFSI